MKDSFSNTKQVVLKVGQQFLILTSRRRKIWSKGRIKHPLSFLSTIIKCWDCSFLGCSYWVTIRPVRSSRASYWELLCCSVTIWWTSACFGSVLWIRKAWSFCLNLLTTGCIILVNNWIERVPAQKGQMERFEIAPFQTTKMITDYILSVSWQSALIWPDITLNPRKIYVIYRCKFYFLAPHCLTLRPCQPFFWMWSDKPSSVTWMLIPSVSTSCCDFISKQIFCFKYQMGFGKPFFYRLI